MAPKHTPGPWHRNIKPATSYPVIFAGRNTHVAQVRFGARHSQSLSEEEIEANCDLIAAAPELLAELSRMVEHFSVWVNDRSLEATTETWATLHCAREVIRRAGGA